jgi:hypothetical protein
VQENQLKHQLVKMPYSKAKHSKLEGNIPGYWTIKFSDWNGKFAPSGSQLHSYFLDREMSPLKSYADSQQEYYQELQQFGH